MTYVCTFNTSTVRTFKLVQNYPHCAVKLSDNKTPKCSCEMKPMRKHNLYVINIRYFN